MDRITELENKVLQLETDKARLQGDKTRLLRQTKTRADVIRLQNAHKAAGALLESWFTGGSISQTDSIADLKMGRYLWSYARALMIYANVHDGERKITAETFEQAKAAIDDALVAILPHGTAPLRRYLPAHIRHEAHRKRKKRAEKQALRAGQHVGDGVGRHVGSRVGRDVGRVSKSYMYSTESGTVGGSMNGGIDRRSEVLSRHGIQGDD